jgi:hypothetical protein
MGDGRLLVAAGVLDKLCLPIELGSDVAWHGRWRSSWVLNQTQPVTPAAEIN